MVASFGVCAEDYLPPERGQLESCPRHLEPPLFPAICSPLSERRHMCF